MALKDTIVLIKKFVNETNQLSHLITSDDFYSDNIMHQMAVKQISGYSKYDTSNLINSIWDDVDDTHNLQMVFDFWKKQLNSICLPNYDNVTFYEKFGKFKYYDEAVNIKGTLLEVCYELRNSIDDFMENNGIKDNIPKSGFLRPLFMDQDCIKSETMQLSNNEHPQQVKQVDKTLMEQPIENTLSHTRGRKKIKFKDCILNDNKEEVLLLLKKLLSGKKGCYVALIIKTCIEEGIVKKPTFACLEDELGYIGHRSGYNKYANNNPFSEDEKKGAKNALKTILKSI